MTDAPLDRRSGAGPARGYSWPPATPGNTLALKHGAHSPRVQGDRAAEVLTEVLAADPPWLQHVDRHELEAWCFAEGQCRGLRAWLAERPPLQPNGKPWPASDELLRWSRRAASHRDSLGFTPLARARLGRDTAVAHSAMADGLEAIRAAGRATTGSGSMSTTVDTDPLRVSAMADIDPLGVVSPIGDTDPLPAEVSPVGDVVSAIADKDEPGGPT